MKMDIKIQNSKELMRQLKQNGKLAQKVLKYTTSDMRRRVPTIVASEVVGVYNLKKKEITPSNRSDIKKGARKAGRVKITGETVSDLRIAYVGHKLSIARFGMKPRTREEQMNSGKRRKTVKAKVERGKVRTFRKSFIAKTKPQHKQELGVETPEIAFIRKGRKRLPIAAVKVLSVPEMIDEQRVRPDITKGVQELLSKRLKHHMERFFK